MDTKAFLGQGFALHGLIQAKKLRIRQLRDMCENISSGMTLNTKVQTSPKHDHIGELMAKIVDAEEAYLEDVIQLMSVQHEIEALVNTVEHANCRLILLERYVHLKEWDDIAKDNKFTLRWVQKLHKRGLELVDGFTKIPR